MSMESHLLMMMMMTVMMMISHHHLLHMLHISQNQLLHLTLPHQHKHHPHSHNHKSHPPDLMPGDHSELLPHPAQPLLPWEHHNHPRIMQNLLTHSQIPQYNPPDALGGILARGSVEPDLRAESPPPDLASDESDDPLLDSNSGDN